MRGPYPDRNCHPEEVESRANRATPDEEPALSLPKGPLQLADSRGDLVPAGITVPLASRRIFARAQCANSFTLTRTNIGRTMVATRCGRKEIRSFFLGRPECSPERSTPSQPPQSSQGAEL